MGFLKAVFTASLLTTLTQGIGQTMSFDETPSENEGDFNQEEEGAALEEYVEALRD